MSGDNENEATLVNHADDVQKTVTAVVVAMFLVIKLVRKIKRNS